MSRKMTIYNNGLEVMDAMAPFYQDVAVARIREANAMDCWFALLQAAAVAPNPLPMQRLEAVSPYIAAERVKGLINSALEGGFLVDNEDSGYALTKDGRSVLAAFFATAQGKLANAPVLPAAEMETLAGYLERLVTATEALARPQEKPNLENSRWTDPGAAASATVRVDQYLTDLRLFRDDAHIAAWQVNDIDGRSWEALTFIWRDDAHTAAELLDKLPRRGFTVEEYAASLDNLAQRGWISQVGDSWQAADLGRAVRQEAEDETDNLFFAGWDTLDEAELADLDDLLLRLMEQLKEAVPVAEPV